jgi:glutamate-1-semialdehyde 2,1-aminomutase
VVTAAGLTTLRLLAEDPTIYDSFDEAGATISRRLSSAFDSVSMPGVVHHVGGMVGVFLGIDEARRWDDVAGLDSELFARFFHAALRRGVLLPPSPYETWFLMRSHLDGPLDEALSALEEAIAEAAS